MVGRQRHRTNIHDYDGAALMKQHVPRLKRPAGQQALLQPVPKAAVADPHWLARQQRGPQHRQANFLHLEMQKCMRRSAFAAERQFILAVNCFFRGAIRKKKL